MYNWKENSVYTTTCFSNTAAKTHALLLKQLPVDISNPVKKISLHFRFIQTQFLSFHFHYQGTSVVPVMYSKLTRGSLLLYTEVAYFLNALNEV